MELDRLEQELGDTPDGCLKRTESQWGIWQFQIKSIVDGLPSLPIHPCSSGPCTAPKNPTCQLGFLGTYLQLFKNAGWIYSASQGICRRLVILSKDQPSVWFSQQGAQHFKTHDIVWWPWFIIRDWLEYIWTQYSAPLSWGEATLSLFTVDDKTGQKGRQGYQQKIGEESWKGARHVLSNPFKPHQKGPIQLQVDLFYIMWPWPIPCHRLSTWWTDPVQIADGLGGCWHRIPINNIYLRIQVALTYKKQSTHFKVYNHFLLIVYDWVPLH